MRTRPRNQSTRRVSKTPRVAKIRRTQVKAYGTRSDWSTIARRIRRRDGNQCRKCGSTEHLQVDHIVPVARGGLTIDSNLWTLCAHCHSRRAGHQKAASLITHKAKRAKK